MPAEPPALDGAVWWRRGLAWFVDIMLIRIVAAGLGYLTYRRIVSPFSGVGSSAHSALKNLFSSGGDIAKVATKTGADVWGIVSSLIIQGFALLVVIHFLYLFIALAWTGRTVGKMLLDVRVVPEASDTVKAKPGKGRAARRAAVSAMADTGLFSLACCLLLLGQFTLSVLCWMVSVMFFLANGLPVLWGRHRSLADMAAGTTAPQGQLYEVMARGAVRGGQFAATHLARGGRAVAERSRNLAELEHVQKVLSSERAQQLRQASKGVTDKGRQALKRIKRRGEEPEALPGVVPPPTTGMYPATGYPPGAPHGYATPQPGQVVPPLGQPVVPPAPQLSQPNMPPAPQPGQVVPPLGQPAPPPVPQLGQPLPPPAPPVPPVPGDPAQPQGFTPSPYAAEDYRAAAPEDPEPPQPAR
ncbi:RDD family protein [Stackebrandtia nassauensis]|uniref:RDD family protein n=1 Tax=Stackebrandtia nassauensis TaxID=283811 RepID=UPI0001A3A503|nr:RDD family protein [Stackebrandtia nassauensis]